MKIEYVPLLGIQSDLYLIARGPDRFQAYAKLMSDDDREDSRLAPLVALNPMARDHVPRLIDDFLGMEAEKLASEWVVEASERLSDVPRAYKIGLVVADDLGGGWTNRYASEFAFASGSPAALRRGWLAGVLWSSESATEQAVREAVLVPMFRAAYVHRHGSARTLRDFMSQEGYAMAQAGCAEPTLDSEDLEYTSQTLETSMDESLARSVMECLYGDVAARTLGFTPRGLSHRAGLALALHRARVTASPAETSRLPVIDCKPA